MVTLRQSKQGCDFLFPSPGVGTGYLFLLPLPVYFLAFFSLFRPQGRVTMSSPPMGSLCFGWVRPIGSPSKRLGRKVRAFPPASSLGGGSGRRVLMG